MVLGLKQLEFCMNSLAHWSYDNILSDDLIILNLYTCIC